MVPGVTSRVEGDVWLEWLSARCANEPALHSGPVRYPFSFSVFGVGFPSDR